MHSVDSRYAWWRLAASVALSSFGAVGMWGVVVIFPALQAEFGASRAEVSFSYATTMLGFGMGSILLGRLINARKDIAAWYSPTAFWPSFNDIPAPRLMCVPDVVPTEFPVGFVALEGIGFERGFGQVETAIQPSA